jgi:hypothetical protein
MPLFSSIALGLALILGHASTTWAQCVRTKISADRFVGQVFVAERDASFGRPISDAIVRLSKLKGDAKINVVSVTTGPDGRFSAEVDSGKYLFEAYAGDFFDPIVTEIRIKRPQVGPRESFLTVGMGLTKNSGTDSCEGFVRSSKRARR